MSESQVTIDWKRETPDFDIQTYNRDHDWRFDGGAAVRGSASPDFKGSESAVDPEEALLASLASCLMLTFLAIAAKKKYVVDSYRDEPSGELGLLEGGRRSMSRATLRPKIEFSGDNVPNASELQDLLKTAHQHCFIANSLKTEVVIEPR